MRAGGRHQLELENEQVVWLDLRRRTFRLLDRIIDSDDEAGAGDDVLFGGAGHDYLYGGIGDDVINGGYGNDRLNGGSGADRFFINSGNSVVEDFNFGEGDSFTIGKNLTNVSFEQDGSDVLVKSDQGLTTILNNDVNDFI